MVQIQNSYTIANFDGKYAWLSNFAESPIEYEGIQYPTVEHAFQAAKTFDGDKRAAIAELETPGKAKRAGRNLQLRTDWEVVKMPIMFELLLLKFADPVLKASLLETGDCLLIEGNNWHDNIWGVCTCDNCKCTGKNTLGTLLMAIRHLYCSGRL